MVYYIAVLDDEYILRDEFDDVKLFSTPELAKQGAIEFWSDAALFVTIRKCTFYE